MKILQNFSCEDFKLKMIAFDSSITLEIFEMQFFQIRKISTRSLEKFSRMKFLSRNSIRFPKKIRSIISIFFAPINCANSRDKKAKFLKSIAFNSEKIDCLTGPIFRIEINIFFRFSRFKMILIIEGNIASGKTTLCLALKKIFPNCEIFLESFNNELFQKYLENPKEFAFKFQFDLLKRKKEIYGKARNSKNLCIIDRGIRGDRIFAHYHYEVGNISLEQYRKYLDFYDTIEELPNSETIYLKVSPEECIRRCCKRSRNGEENYDINFFKTISSAHDMEFSNEIVVG